VHWPSRLYLLPRRDPVRADHVGEPGLWIIALTIGLIACGSQAPSGPGDAGRSESGTTDVSGGASAGDSAKAPESGADVRPAPADATSTDAVSDTSKGETACQPAQCFQAGGQYCGSFPDGCGGLAKCGDCPTGEVCGGAGIAHVCGGDPNCKPIPCSAPTFKFCGHIGDGCGRPLDCGGCTLPKTCGGGGIANVCGP